MHRHCGSLAFALLILTLAVAAQPPMQDVPAPVPPQENVPAEASVAGITTIRVAALWDDPRLKAFRDGFAKNAPVFAAEKIREFGIPIEQIERLTTVQFQMGGGGEFGPVHLTVLTPRKPVSDEQIVKATDMKVIVKRGDLAGQSDVAIYQKGANSLALTGKQIVVLESYADGPEARKLMSEMLAKARQRDTDRAALAEKSKCIVSAVFDDKSFRNFIEASSTAEGNEFPEAMRPLLNVRVITVEVAVNASIVVSIQSTFGDAAAAMAAKPAVAAGLMQILAQLEGDVLEAKGTPVAELSAFAQTLVNASTITVTDRTVTATASGAFTPALQTTLAQVVRVVEQQANRAAATNNLKQIGLAIHTYHDNSNSMPVNILSAAGKPLLSWRVHLLPFLEEDALYKQFKLDEPWDSEHNKKLIPKMPKVFRVPSEKPAGEGLTFYQTFVSKKGVNPRAFHRAEDTAGISLASISDGSSNTIMVAEAAEAVTWTKPDDMAFDPAGKLPKLGGHFDGGFHVLFCDASVRFLKSSVKESTLKAAITADGGEVIDFDQE